MAKGCFIIFLILGWLVSTPAVWADTVVLKNGQKIEARIIEKTRDHLRLDIQGVAVTYWPDEIESVNAEPFVLGESARPSDPGAGGANKIPAVKGKEQISGAFGTIEYLSPDGWQKLENRPFDDQTTTLLLFKKADFNSLALIAITRETPPEGAKTALEYSRLAKKKMESQEEPLVTSDPMEVPMAGLSAAYLELNENNSARAVFYYFLVKGTIITCRYSNVNNLFSRDVSVFRQFMDNFRIVQE